MMKLPTLIAVGTSCFFSVVLTSGIAQAKPQSDAKPVSHMAETTDGEWIKHSAEVSNAEIYMPAKPSFSERTFRPVADEPFITVKTWQCTADGGQILFRMSYNDLHQLPITDKKMGQVLDGAARITIAQVIGSSEGVENVNLRTYPGRKFTYEFTVNEQALKSDVEIYLIGKRLYMISTIFKQAKYKPELSQKFFETFNPFDPQDSTLVGNDTGESADESFGGNLDGLDIPDGVEPVELK